MTREVSIVSGGSLHFVTVGSRLELVRDLWDRVAAAGGLRVSHILHPGLDRAALRAASAQNTRCHPLRENIGDPLPRPDHELLAELEKYDGVPTIRNMIMSDRYVAGLPYEEALAYATVLTRRLMALYEKLAPSVIVGGFDALHGSLALAVARHMGIPWFCLYFGSRPSGYAAFCRDLSPASLVAFDSRPREELERWAKDLLLAFEQGRAPVAYYIPPEVLSLPFMLKRIPAQLQTLGQVLRRRRLGRGLRFSDPPSAYSMRALIGEAVRLRRNEWQLKRHRLLDAPISERFAFFGLHMQPESSIDVCAHFFSNQTHVIELIVRALPPTHKLLVKLHKSDALNYSNGWLRELTVFPGVELVSPHASSREFIEQADLVFSIQGTIGLESALLGKPVIMFGDSPTKVFPSVTTVGRTIDLPALVRAKLAERAPERAEIVAALWRYLAPFYPASANDWSVVPSDAEIADYARLFRELQSSLCQEAQPESA